MVASWCARRETPSRPALRTAAETEGVKADRARARRLTRRFASGLMARNAFDAAASIAFWFFLSLVPLLVLVGYVVGRVARDQAIDQLVGPFLHVVPSTAVGLVHNDLERPARAPPPSSAP